MCRTLGLILLPFLLLGEPTSALAGSEPSPPELDARAFYGQGFEFWSKVDALRRSSDNVNDLVQLLDSSIDRPQEGIAAFGLRYESPADRAFLGIVDRAYFGAGSNALAGGAARNRILPRIQAHESFTGHLDFGLARRAPSRRSGWEYGAGTTLGAGQQTLVEGSLADLVDDFVPSRVFVFYTGLDAHLGYRNRYSESLRSSYRISLQPTFFHSDYSASGSRYPLQSDQVTLRWREQSEWELTVDTGYEPLLDLGIQAIFGQQPLPQPLLPRAWDGIHALSAWPAFGQLVGLGAKAHAYLSSEDFGACVYAGFYGGYPGAGALVHLFAIQLSAGTYGIEQRSGYRIDDSRINYVSIGGRFAL